MAAVYDVKKKFDEPLVDRFEDLEKRHRCLQYGLLGLGLTLLLSVVAVVLVFLLVPTGVSSCSCGVPSSEPLQTLKVQEPSAHEKSLPQLEEDMQRLEQSLQKLSTQMASVDIAMQSSARKALISIPNDDEDDIWFMEPGSGGGYPERVFPDNSYEEREEIDISSYYDLNYYDEEEGSAGYNAAYVTEEKPNKYCPPFSSPVCPDNCVHMKLIHEGCRVPICC